MTSTYYPDSWEIIHVIPKDTSADYYCVLAGWSGSFMYGNSWKVSSGCDQVFDMGDYWKVTQDSGSVYNLRKNSEHSSLAVSGVFQKLVQSNAETTFKIVKMENILGDL